MGKQKKKMQELREVYAEQLEIQDQEIEALKNIYPDAFEELAVPEDEIQTTSHVFSVKLVPFADDLSNCFAGFKLKVSFDFDYPSDSVPGIDLDDCKGLSDKQKEEVLGLMRKEATASAGEECVYQLIDIAINYLRQNNTKPLSFYEEMMARQKEMQNAVKNNHTEEVEEEPSADSWLEPARDENAQRMYLQRKEEAMRARELRRKEKDERRKEKSADGNQSQDNHPSRASTTTTMMDESYGLDVSKTGAPAGEPGSKESQLMLLHLVRHFCGQGGGSDAFDTIVDQLCKLGLVDKQDDLVQNEKAFADIFGKVFHRQLVSNDHRDIVLAKFWNLPESAVEDTSGGYSRYRSDFEEILILGRGSFGEVVKVRNKLDGRYYAIKKIRLDDHDQELNRRIMREVTTLSRLHHPHVVRYYQAWIEGGEDEDSEESDEWGVSLSQQDQESYSEGFSLHSDSLFKRVSRSGDDGKSGKPAPLEAGPSDISSKNRATFLYIQMEFCKKRTLRSLVHSCGFNDSQQIWQFFRQILEGLTHIHAQGIIHRDLKPANVFFDSIGDIKIGDFGLATDALGTHGQKDTVEKVKDTTYAPVDDEDEDEDDETESDSGDSEFDDPTRTAGVGTFLYTAPEQEQEGGYYDEKVDMYALGIIFFEMWFPFETAHERAMIIQQLRKNIEFPPNFEENFPRQAKITRWLLQYHGRDRPGANELLSSDLLPPKMEDEYLKDALRAIANPNSTFYTRILAALFDAQRKVPQAATMVDVSTDALPDPLQSTVLEKVTSTVTTVFRRHGAVPMQQSPFDVPRDVDIVNPSEFASFMDPSGTKFYLQYNLRLPFARHLAVTSSGLAAPIVQPFKRYIIEKVYRPASTSGMPPRHLHQCDMDIVGIPGAIAEAELIHVLQDIMEEFTELPRFGIRMNDRRFVDAMYKSIGIPPEKFGDVSEILGALVRSPWAQVRRQLLQRNVITAKAALDKLEKWVACKGALTPTLEKIVGMLDMSDPLIKEGATYMAQFIEYTELLGLNESLITLDMSYIPRESYFGGLSFQVVLKENVKSPEVIAVGGRYDDLVRFLRPREKKASQAASSRMVVPAVGVSIALEQISKRLEDQVRNSKSGQFRVSETDVFVCSVGSESIGLRIKLTAALWGNGVKAECLYTEEEDLPQQISIAAQKGINWIVTIKDKNVQDGTVKVKNVERKTEVDVNIGEVPKFFSSLSTHGTARRTNSMRTLSSKNLMQSVMASPTVQRKDLSS